MHRRLTELSYRVRHFLRSVVFLIRRTPATMRRWAVDWFDVLALPVRILLRPRELGSEFLRGGRDALSLGGGAARGTLATVVGFVWFLLCSPLLVLRFLFYDLPYRLRVFAHWNTPTRIFIAVIAAIGVSAGLGLWGYYTFSERRAHFQRDIYWRMFKDYVDRADVEKVETALVELQRLLPDNGTVTDRLNMLRAREAPNSDPTMVRLIMRTWYREQRYDLAAKEAAKLIVDQPNDWEALCFLTNEALAKGDMAAVRGYVADMPRARDVPEQIYLWTIPYALNLFRRLGDKARYDETLNFTIENFLTRLMWTDLESEHPSVKMLLFDCYEHAMSQIDRRPQLTKYWEGLQRASKSVLHADGITANELARLGVSVEQQLVHAQKFFVLKYITPEQRKQMAEEVESRLTEIWNAVLKLDAKNAKGYVGLAHQHYRAGDAKAAVDLADRGIAACGKTPLLVACRAKYLCLADPKAGGAYLESALQEVELTPDLCMVWYEVERGAGRRDKARDACVKALELDPTLYWAHVGLGAINLELEKWTEAAAALDPVRLQLLQDPLGCRLYVRALCECGADNVVDMFLTDAKEGPLEVLIEAAIGLQQAKRFEKAADLARQALERDNTHPIATMTLAECLAKLAEDGETRWDREKVHEAIKHFRHVQQRHPKALLPANNIAWLELKALGQPNDAYESAAPLRASQKTDTFPPAFLETLGAIEVEKGRDEEEKHGASDMAQRHYEEGRKYLQMAVDSGEAKASYFYHLALAYFHLHQQDKAEALLFRSANLQKSPREQAEYLEIAKTIRKGH
jgi:tetratricopeptide (TPR) repeat protein